MAGSLPTSVAEQIEIEAYSEFAVGTREPAHTTLGIASRRFGSARAVTVRNDSTGFWTKAGGFDGPVTVDLLAEVCDFFREHGARSGSIAIAPDALPDDWPDISDKLGLRAGETFVKLGCEVDAALSGRDGLATLDPALRVEQVEPQHADRWAEVMMTTFEMTDEGMTDMAASAIGRPNWRSFAVWDGDDIVATGSWFRHGAAADMFGGATAPAGRNRGAQSALLTTRARFAAEQGCTWLVADTEADPPGGHNPSLHNLMRLGLRPLYERTEWIWQSG
ncbi:MAG TPA: hypothetical protein VHV74_12235 [Pseudonocardiaceae bacterium]|nr:hypothetical protein [Pseudonocardiaceae bacterium]